MKAKITASMLAVVMISFVLKTANAQENSPTYDEGVLINGVKWATRNVDEFRTFAPTPESFGKLYQWNRKKAWNAVDENVENWVGSLPQGIEWTNDNDPCPSGWRLPTLNEFEKLLNSGRTWTEVNGIKGSRFGSGDSTLFLPAAGYRSGDNTSGGILADTGTLGYYWSRTGYNAVRAHLLLFFYADVDTGGVGADKRHAYAVRCVSE